MKLLSRLVLSSIFLSAFLFASGQARQAVDSVITAVNTMRERMPVEKLYLQTDKDNYIQGDTIWFKAYLLDGSYLTPSVRSGLLYAEIDDSDNHCVKRILLPLTSGVAWGNIRLNERAIPEGSYTLRAYTNWMRNFGETYVFKKNMFVASSGNRSTLVEAGFKEAGNNIRANILLTDFERSPLRLQDLQLQGMNGRRTLFKKSMATGVDGRLDINFNVPPDVAAKNLSLIANETSKGKTTESLAIPVTVNRPENTDLQFMPEGGALVSGINTRIGFKAISEDGRGVDVSGRVFNSRQQEVASFTSACRGIGSFELMPQPGETYTARLSRPNGAMKSYALPAVVPAGTSLKVRLHGEDSIAVTVAARGIKPAGYYLIGQSRGVVCYAAHFILGGTSEKLMAKSLFPAGIARFTLLNAAKRPLNERIAYIDRQDNLQVNIATGAQSYAPHDSIALNIQVTDKAGKPVSGNFSLAVTDAGQVKTDSLGGNILNNLLLTSDLKGTVEEPGYYFADTAAVRLAALDNLLLTQGWVGYPWPAPNVPQAKPLFAAEPEYMVTGSVTNGFNKPLKKADIVLLSGRPRVVMDTVSDDKGRFTFKGVFPVDTAAFIVQGKRKSGSNFNILVNVDEFKPPVFVTPALNTVPWYVNTDTLLLRNKGSKLSQHLAEDKINGTGNMLKEVVIKDKKFVKDSKNLNGSGAADYVLDQNDMHQAKKLTLFALLFQKFKSFNRTGIGESAIYTFKGHIVKFVIDGLFIDAIEGDVDSYMDYLTAEDIKGIEIMYTSTYALAYDPDFIFEEITKPDRSLPVFFEITTHSGRGAFLKKIPDHYIYKPLAFSLPKQFYRPRYTVKNNINGTDQRSTIHWEPNIVTDTTGKAVVSFYSADKPATYNIIMQGTDLNGRLGFTREKVLIHN